MGTEEVNIDFSNAVFILVDPKKDKIILLFREEEQKYL